MFRLYCRGQRAEIYVQRIASRKSVAQTVNISDVNLLSL